MKVKLLLLLALSAVSCTIEPALHLHRDISVDVTFPVVDIDLNAIWQYDFDYDYHREWVYGWDKDDEKAFGTMGYYEPNAYELRRYFLGGNPDGPRRTVRPDYVKGGQFRATFDFGYYDILSWSDVDGEHDVQAIIIEESIDSVTARTNPGAAMRSYRYPGTRTTRIYNQPEQLFACEINGVDMNDTPGNFDWSDELDCWYKKMDLDLQPVTYIYLIQVLLHNNNGRIYGVDGSCSLSAMASGVSLNTGVTTGEAITVGYYSRFKKDMKIPDTGETVDVIGGRAMTFGICNVNPSKVTKAEEMPAPGLHYIDVDMIFYNGLDSTLVFDVTDQVNRLYKGGVITVDLDVNEVSIPNRPGGSGFDAVVLDPDEEIYEIEM